MVSRFAQVLADHGLSLVRGRTTTLQVNVGLLCNLACRHCHLAAGPDRREVMSRATMADVAAFARRHPFAVIDVTGGAPELVPGIVPFMGELAALAPRVLLRTNLVALRTPSGRDLLETCRTWRVTLVASFPSANRGQADAQRGEGFWQQSTAVLQELNRMGYGRPGTGLELFLVSNPAGAFLPAGQCTAERKMKADLARKWGIEFTGLFTFANVPLGRFKTWLEESDNYQAYMTKLTAGFNPATLTGLMCRTQISISWEGYLYDCDFNLAAGLPYSGRPVPVAGAGLPAEGEPIMTDDYCFACTAGAGFT